MKRYIYWLPALCVTIGLFVLSCTNDFESINTNTKSPNSASPYLLLPGVIVNGATAWDTRGAEEGLTVTQHAAMISSVGDDIYEWEANDEPYESGYSVLRNIYNMIEASEESDALSAYYGAGLILKCWMYDFMADAYGDIPYTDAIEGKTDANFFPEFTEQSVIYAGMLSDLETANELLAAAPDNLDGDILYDGDVTKWQKLANSMRLRLLMRMSDVEQATAIAGIQEIVNDPTTYPLMESNDDAAVLTHESSNPPIWYDSRSGTFEVYRLSKTLEDRLKAMNDWRIAVYAQPTTASGEEIFSSDMDDYQGLPNGLSEDDAQDYSPTDNEDEAGTNYVSKLGALYACSECIDDASYTADQSVIMHYSEVQFLLAEALLRGFITSGDAETYYQNGIQASFDYYAERVTEGGWTDIADALNNTDMTTYFAQDGVAFTGSDDDDLSKVYLQKWITQAYVGMEAWADWRRTAQPTVTPGPAALSDVPTRFMYPDDVKSTNYDHYAEAVERLGADDLESLLWWDVAEN